MRKVYYADSDEAIIGCIDAILELRPMLQRNKVLSQIKDMQTDDGYMLIYVMADEDNSKVAAIAGFRHLNKLLCGKHIYIDDLSTLPEYRGKGYGSLLLNHVKELAIRQGLGSVRLSSGYTSNDAHRLYLQHGYNMTAHNFMLKL